MSDQNKVYRDYAPDLRAPGRPQVLGTPRAGFGTVYVHLTNVGDRDPRVIWAADWIDDFGEPDERGASVGVSSVEGSRDEVLRWVREQPAATFLMPGADGWVPLPADDEAVVLRIPNFPGRPRR